MKSPVILRIYKDDKLQEVKQFDVDQIIFGQDAEVQVELKNDQISAIHCLIELRESGYYICDLGSVAGTFKNGTQILDEPISSGDQIKMGPYTIHFFVGIPKPKAPPSVSVEEMAPTPKTAPKVAPVVASIPVVAPVAEMPAPPKLPESVKAESRSRSKSSLHLSSKRGRKTFAPPSEIEDLRKTLKPGKGPSVEVVLAWRERVLSTHSFEIGRKVTMGPDLKCDLFIPQSFIGTVTTLLDNSSGCRINIPANAKTELIGSGRSVTGSQFQLEQGEMLVLTFDSGTYQIFIRYAPRSIAPLLAPMLDMTSGELTAIVATFVFSALTALYMSVYTPRAEELLPEEDQVRLAQFIYNKPKETPTPRPTPAPKQEVQKDAVSTAKPTPTPEKKVVKMTDNPEQKKMGKKDSIAAVTERPAAKASEVRPMPSKVDRPKKFTSIKQGGAVKVGDKEGANAASAKDVTKTGLMAAFGGGGTRSQLDQAYSGAGDLIGMANEATGKAGQNENRAGEDLGSKFKDTGVGGKGTATSGIAGIGTKGRGAGQNSYGGIGTSGKGSVAIEAGGAEAEFVGGIDREAVRRVVRSRLAEIKSCYERALNVDKSLEGKVVIHFEIEEQGHVRLARAKSSSLNNRAVEECVAARIKNAVFPEPPPGTVAEVDYPFVFGSQN